VAREPEGVVRLPSDTLDQAQRLVDEGKPFHAHEVLEDAWKSAPSGERALWKGLAQLAVGLTHAARGNHSGAVRLLRRAATAIDEFASDPPYHIDVAGLSMWAIQAADEIERNPSFLPRIPRLTKP
jgi:predicted metal-dependent hydrolase